MTITRRSVLGAIAVAPVAAVAATVRPDIAGAGIVPGPQGVTGISDSGLPVARQPLVPLGSGVIQPLPPLTGFSFPGKVVEYHITPTGTLYWICAGPDHNLWITDQPSGGVWRVTTAGVPTFFALSGGLRSNNITGICVGSDDKLWIAGGNGGGVWRLTPGGAQTFIPVPGSFSLSSVTAGPDGNLWVTDLGYSLYRITTAGVVTRFSTPFAGQWGCIGPDNATLWIATGGGMSEVAQVSTAGAVLQTIPMPGAGSLQAICTGADANLWVTDAQNPGGSVWKVTPAGAVSRFVLTGGDPRGAQPFGICGGAGGDLWAMDGFGWLYKITVDGTVTAFPGSGGQGICVGPDGALWSGGYSSGKVRTFPFITEQSAANITSGDLTFAHAGQGPVIVDQSNGHTYRIVSSGGALGLQVMT